MAGGGRPGAAVAGQRGPELGHPARDRSLNPFERMYARGRRTYPCPQAFRSSPSTSSSSARGCTTGCCEVSTRWCCCSRCARAFTGGTRLSGAIGPVWSCRRRCLVRLADRELDDVQKKAWSTRALEHTRQLARLCPGSDEFSVKSTRLQCQRHVNWWGTEPFANTLASRELGRRCGRAR